MLFMTIQYRLYRRAYAGKPPEETTDTVGGYVTDLSLIEAIDAMARYQKSYHARFPAVELSWNVLSVSEISGSSAELFVPGKFRFQTANIELIDADFGAHLKDDTYWQQP